MKEKRIRFHISEPVNEGDEVIGYYQDKPFGKVIKKLKNNKCIISLYPREKE